MLSHVRGERAKERFLYDVCTKIGSRVEQIDTGRLHELDAVILTEMLWVLKCRNLVDIM